MPRYLLLAFILSLSGLSLSGQSVPQRIADFVDRHCADCHDDDAPKAELDLWSLTLAPLSVETLEAWVKVHDRAKMGEMPPKEERRPHSAELKKFLRTLSEGIVETEQRALEETGRSIKRRLNRYEYENSVRDLLSLPYLEIKNSLPEDSMAHGYNKIGEALDVSHVQVARYLRAAEYALREALAPQLEKPEKTLSRYYTWQQTSFRRPAGPTIRKTFPVVGLELQKDLIPGRDPKTRQTLRPDLGAASQRDRVEEEAVAMLMSTYEPAEITFNDFRAPVTGRYRLRFSGYTIWMAPDFSKVTRGRRSEPITIYSDTRPRLLRRLGGFDFEPEPTEHELEVWLKAGETIRPDAARLVRSRPPDFKNPLLEKDGMPGVAFQWMEVEGPFFDEWPPAGHRLLFGDLPVTDAGGVKGQRVEVSSASPAEDVEKLLSRFLRQAYRRPVAEEELQGFTRLTLGALDKGHSFTDAMIAGYTAALASPGFLYLDPNPGKLEANALAERLSYFLWNSPPDETLRELALSGELIKPRTLSKQVVRMLDDSRSRRFIDAFLDYWLDLRKLAASGPDSELYPEYQLDDLLMESLPTETQLYFSELVKGDLGVGHLVDSDFLIINERLAALYDIADVWGADFRKVSLPEHSSRGGLMTQASVLKVTANGTSTSPVTRGNWIMKRMLGYDIPPPPASVEVIESDIRGASTIREQLALHRSEESCNVCHRKIDPAGFALESFDVMGRWRESYRSSSKGEGRAVKGFGHDGLVFRFLEGLPVDPSGELPDGQGFDDIRELKRLLLDDEVQLARNLVEQLAIYATGAPIRFSDRPLVDGILKRSRRSDYGVRSLIHELVKSELFLHK